MANVAVLVIGGGGGGGHHTGGGGGAASVEYNAAFSLAAGTYEVTIGDGGAGGESNVGTDGQDSIFSSITSHGGGAGGGWPGYTQPNSGGSGGGGTSDGAVVNNAGSGSNVNSGGKGTSSNYNGGGGGGAGSVGVDATSGGAGDGGSGYSSTILDGSTDYYAGGGGGGANVGAGGAAQHGGGAGGANGVAGTAGTSDTGAGGGGGGTSANGAKGGSGVVIIRYLTSDYAGYTSTGGTKTTDGDYTVHKFVLADSGTDLVIELSNAPPSTPTNTTPANSATGVSRNPTLVGSTYSDPESDAHTISTWQIATDSGFTSVVWSKADDNTNLTSIVVNSTNGTFAGALSGKTKLATSTVYYWRVKYKDATAYSAYSTGTSFTTVGPTITPNERWVKEEFGKYPVKVARSSQVSTVDGIPTDSASDGVIRVDTENNDLYFRSNGAWIKVVKA